MTQRQLPLDELRQFIKEQDHTDGEHIILVKVKPTVQSLVEKVKMEENHKKLHPTPMKYHFGHEKYFTKVVKSEELGGSFVMCYHGSPYRHKHDEITEKHQDIGGFFTSDDYNDHMTRNLEETLHKILIWARLHHIPIEYDEMDNPEIPDTKFHRARPFLINVLGRRENHCPVKNENPVENGIHIEHSGGGYICAKPEKKMDKKSSKLSQLFLLIPPELEEGSEWNPGSIPFMMDKKRSIRLTDSHGYQKSKLSFV